MCSRAGIHTPLPAGRGGRSSARSGASPPAWFARRSETLGVHDGRPGFYVALYVASAIGCSLCGSLVPEPWTYPCVFGVVGLLNLGIGLVDRYPLVTGVGAATLVVSGVAGAAELDPAAFSVVLGVALLIAAVIARLIR